MSRGIGDLAFSSRAKVLAVQKEMAGLGYALGCSFTFRSLAEQEALYAQGRTAPGPIITKTRRGWHNLTRSGRPAARAVDWYFKRRKDHCDHHGKTWNEFSNNWPWELLYYVAQNHGLKRTLKWDKGHFVDTQGQSFSQAWSARS